MFLDRQISLRLITRATCFGLGILFLFLPPLSSASTLARAPLALHQLLRVDAGGEIVVGLDGYNYNSDETTAIITSLPKEGKLHQLSSIYNSHGYDPKAGTLITEADLPCQVVGGNSRVVYQAPVRQYNLGRWDIFEYTVSDRYGTSKAGTVTLVGTSRLIVASDFRFDDEGWTTVGNKQNAVTYEDTSMGIMNRYIYSQDDIINVNEEGDDMDIWRFNLPPKFTGWHGIAYGGFLDFSLSSLSGDFSPDKLNTGGDLNLVEIACDRCAFNKGITIGFPLSALPNGFTGMTSSFSLHLNETAGWLKDPHNPLHDWTVPSKCEVIEVMSRISSISIMGDFTTYYEGVSIDNVQLRASEPQGKHHLPSCAQEMPDARRCSC